MLTELPPYMKPKTVYECRSNISHIMKHNGPQWMIDHYMITIEIIRSDDRYNEARDKLNVILTNLKTTS